MSDKNTPKVWPGRPYPLGATFDGAGVNFALFTEAAQRVVLCLFDEGGKETQIDLHDHSAFVWHGYLPGLSPGQRYGYRVHGAWDPGNGLRCNPAKLLLDPYSKAIDGDVKWDDALFGHQLNNDSAKDERDSAPFMPHSVVVNPYFDWGNDAPPMITLHETIIYETHVKGISKLNPEVPEEMRGSYAGLGHSATVDHLKRLGVSAVELMPVHQFISDRHLVEKGLTNYWGYNTISFFAPHNAYASTRGAGQQVQEFKGMVKRLHEARIEVILDVVYNHTPEGNHLGPTLCYKGIDNHSYYRLTDKDQRYYMDYTGTGNSLNVRHPHVLQMIMDSLRYWITEMHVDGFRFDLAAALARELHDVDKLSAFFDIIHQDPVIGQAKLIAEPWDMGEGGYQVGKFPPQWSEWNSSYRDAMRSYWRGDDMTLGEMANRFTGSSDLYEGTGRRPHASVNFVTAHDGFTLEDQVSYNGKHNEANKEDNRDGMNDNRSWNMGAEGPTDNKDILELRARQKRNLLTTLLLSMGLPMVLGGDEIGRTQKGNNNAYCQDSDISWYDWEHADYDLTDFAAHVIEMRKKHPVFRRWKWFSGQVVGGEGIPEVGWYKPDGAAMTEGDWKTWYSKALTIFLRGDLKSLDDHGEPVVDADFLIIMNAGPAKIDFKIPNANGDGKWQQFVDTTKLEVLEEGPTYDAGGTVPVESRSMAVLAHVIA